MRLLNTSTLEFREFYGPKTVRYAVLSHTWTDGEEISYRDFLDLNPAWITKSGFQKVQGACRIARKDGVEWIWIDTNCIDKSSSAELSEAINSMYAWYREASICYAYLSDVPDINLSERDSLRHFRRSRWFTRGWTLQELIAPRALVFYSQSWKKIGHRSDKFLLGTISGTTGVPTSILTGKEKLHQISLAKKMSWAARRVTTRVEDMAYCLLGIFDVNMPLLYGEGAKAFTRLQEEIIKTSNDHTIFCWTRHKRANVPPDWTSMLAPSPQAFADSGDFIPVDAWENPMPYPMTNLGLSIHLPLIYTLTQIFVVLDAGLSSGNRDTRACIAMQRATQRRTATNILHRSKFFESATMLSGEATDRREGHNLVIRSRHDPHIDVDRPCPTLPVRRFKHGIMLFVHPTARQLLYPGRHGMPLGSMGYDIESHPPGVFDNNTAILRLPAFDGGSALLTSGLLRICFKSPQDHDVYLFFGVVSTLGGKEVWRCNVHFVDEMHEFLTHAMEQTERQKRGERGVTAEEVHQYLRLEAWMDECEELRAHTSDESLYVSIGGQLPGDAATDLRAALLSGSEDSPHPRPLFDDGDVADDEDDEDFVEIEEDDSQDAAGDDDDADESPMSSFFISSGMSRVDTLSHSQ
ncbi:hypothetical protein Daus18300_006939 [Diaporthe australafricana]|uniref:Heterokaryon incompatibility domain-containing protein n=1 Tax=Diaporthe australafricana TaxID=127596 RepID=A0ABR3WR70_9PEZI